MTSFRIEHFTLFIYAILLAAGGGMGFVKAKSKASLIAGVLSAVAAVAALVLSLMGISFGIPLGMLLAIVMFLFFGYRLALRRKFMPAGLIAVASLVVLGVLIWTTYWVS
jgi:uncharacterized membrane protein (UPF0136 family)